MPTKNGIRLVVGMMRVISYVTFFVKSEFEQRIGPSHQNFEIFEVMWLKNGVK